MITPPAKEDYSEYYHTYVKKVGTTDLLAGLEDEMETNPWFDPADLVVASPQLIDEGNGLRRVRVEISYPFQTVINWPFLPGYNDTFQIRGMVVMRAIR